MRKWFLLGLLCSLLLPGYPGRLSLAQTQPTTGPAGASTPLGALRVLNLGLRDGDAKAIEAVLLATTPQEQRMVKAQAGYAASLARLHQAALAAFGEDGARTVTSDLEAESAQGLAAIDKAEVTIKLDDATVQYPGAQDPPLRLKRVGGFWKIALWPLGQEANPRTVDQRVSDLDQLTREAALLGADIAKAKFPDAEKAAQAWRNRVLETVAPTTQPNK